jgi:SET domain-containing protein
MKYTFRKSNIHGIGAFAKVNLDKNEPIDIGIDFILYFIPYVTEFGSKINHNYTPNCRLEYIDGKWYVVAKDKIQRGTEITLNYSDTPWFILGPEPHYK